MSKLIRELKQPYKALALVRQKEQGREPNEDADVVSIKYGLTWCKTKEGNVFWCDIVHNGNYPPIPPDSLKDIPLQVRWDSGERFRSKKHKIEIEDLHVYTNLSVVYFYKGGNYGFQFDQEAFFEHFETIPPEPQTRWVTTMIEKDGSFKTVLSDGVIVGFSVVFSVQQQLINSKWVNV